MTNDNIVSIVDKVFEKYNSQNYTIAYPITNSEYNQALSELKKELKIEIDKEFTYQWTKGKHHIVKLYPIMVRLIGEPQETTHSKENSI